MRLLPLDESVPAGLKRLLTEFDVKTAPEMGWAGISNGRVLAVLQPDNRGSLDGLLDAGECCSVRHRWEVCRA
jgi:hypothetical protein